MTLVCLPLFVKKVVENRFVQYVFVSGKNGNLSMIVFEDRYLDPLAHHSCDDVDGIVPISFNEIVDSGFIKKPKYFE